MQRELDGVCGVAEVGGVRIGVAADGRLVVVEIAERALGLGSARLAALVAEAHRGARERARAESEGVLAELLDDPMVARAFDLAGALDPAGEATGPVAAGQPPSFLQDPLAPTAQAAPRPRW
ncbi:hypothetical protein ACFYVR_13435 [Rhodococcus sp. NPDC003318]|uniref:hypothetical protein n=1 Tax=Rhodococcus sp. NPDC003318 TaxID=3364503 RepID=UPI0036CA02D7